MDLPPLGGTLKEPFEIKVYEIDDVECLQRKREVVTESEVSFMRTLKAALCPTLLLKPSHNPPVLGGGQIALAGIRLSRLL